ncbi:MAG: tetratricopeptide repeat protein [Anaerohalosphaeraceae bacterium]
MSQTKSPMYQQALSLAEAGQHEQALRLIRSYLQTNPNDPEALNDTGTILFCMNRGAEAIEILEKARGCAEGDILSQILWNLCETYLQEGHPAEAASLFDTMEQHGVLNVDVLNRAANVFLNREAVGGAMECMLRSLHQVPEQEILHPMFEIIRSKRPVMTVAADTDTPAVRQVHEYLNLRFRTQLTVADPRQLAQTNATLFVVVGAGRMLGHLSMNKPAGRTIAILSAQDVYNPVLKSVCWNTIDQVLVCGTTEQADMLTEQIHDIHKKTHVQMTEEPLDIQDWTFTQRSRGKRLGAVGPFNACNNPMFLIQCMQKLNYLDRDYRLYLAGEFQDKAIERYCRNVVSRMNLEGVVFFDGPLSNLQSWLRDKHYFVHGSINPAGMHNVWAAMASGVKPVVHGFAGAEEWMDSRYLFMIAEEFCAVIQSSEYQPGQYRQWIETRHSQGNFYKTLNTTLSKLERQIQLSHAATRPAESCQTPTVAAPSRPAAPAAPRPYTQAPAMPVQPQQVWTPPAVPAIPAAPQSRVPEKPETPQTDRRSISEIAENALKASQRLRDMLNEANEQSNTSQENFSVPFVR